MKIWSEQEIEFLKLNYPDNGLLFCVENLEKSKSQIKAKINKLFLKRTPDLKYSKEVFEGIIKKSINLVDVCRNLSISLNYGNRQTIRKYIELYDLNIEHFYIPVSSSRKKLTLDEILVEKSEYRDTTNLKDKLYKAGLKQRFCELCDQNEYWNGKRMSLILDHINGVNNDNRITNLRIVCPNCNATLDTHCKGSNKLSNKYIQVEKIDKLCDCGVKIDDQSNKCMKCSSISQRKVERPSLESLLEDINKLGYSATGRKYGVSDNAIRKWIKNYNKE